jgi:anti-anti-sigma factor
VVSVPAEMGQCSLEMFPGPTGNAVVLRVVIDLDLGAVAVVDAALTRCLDMRPAHLIVDLEKLRFCAACGMRLLVETGLLAAAKGIRYSLAAVPPRLEQRLVLFWPDLLPRRYRTTAAARASILAPPTPWPPA